MKKKIWLWILVLAYVIDRLFKRKQPEVPELTMELKYAPGPEREPDKFEAPKDILCPYCNYRFAEMLKRSCKCPECKKYIYRTKDYERKVYQLITEEQHDKEVQIEAEEWRAESKKDARSRLRYFQKNGIKGVRISTCNDEVTCPACRSQEGKIYLIEDALKEMPIPCKDCTADLHGIHTSVGWCRCMYVAEFDFLSEKEKKELFE